MRRVCAWCFSTWEASGIDPPIDEPYFCPKCQRYEGAGKALWREVKKDAGTAGEACEEAGGQQAMERRRASGGANQGD